jgi:fatty acid desaturase
VGGTIYVLAGEIYSWQVQHNVLHHTYTNIPGHDENLLPEELFVLLKKRSIVFTFFNNVGFATDY